ncbi:unnamed protein product, partial [Brenthis ino]
MDLAVTKSTLHICDNDYKISTLFILVLVWMNVSNASGYFALEPRDTTYVEIRRNYRPQLARRRRESRIINRHFEVERRCIELDADWFMSRSQRSINTSAVRIIRLKTVTRAPRVCSSAERRDLEPLPLNH